MVIIEPMQKLKTDKSGLNTLAARKLVSDSYYHEYQASEAALNSEIEYCFFEAELLEQGWSKTIFDQAIHFWKVGMKSRMEARIANGN